jgi:molybdopterin-guanine dinucleotide biosynthesis protein A
VSGAASQPIGVILAGGAGRRIGGRKALVALRGRPLISYPLAAMRRAVQDVAVVAKPDSRLPSLPGGVAVWTEPAQPRHPLVGIVHALRCAEGRAVLVCAADMPFVGAATLAALARADAGDALAVVATSGGGLQPQLGRYEPGALDLLAAVEAGVALREAVGALHPALVELDESVTFNVNTPADLARAEQLLRNGPTQT